MPTPFLRLVPAALYVALGSCSEPRDDSPARGGSYIDLLEHAVPPPDAAGLTEVWRAGTRFTSVAYFVEEPHIYIAGLCSDGSTSSLGSQRSMSYALLTSYERFLADVEASSQRLDLDRVPKTPERTHPQLFIGGSGVMRWITVGPTKDASGRSFGLRGKRTSAGKEWTLVSATSPSDVKHVEFRATVSADGILEIDTENDAHSIYFLRYADGTVRMFCTSN